MTKIKFAKLMTALYALIAYAMLWFWPWIFEHCNIQDWMEFPLVITWFASVMIPVFLALLSFVGIMKGDFDEDESEQDEEIP